MLEKVPASIGRALSNVRAGATKLAIYDEAFADVPETIEVRSPSFADGQAIPERYTADGAGTSPQLAWRLPGDAASLVLLVEDSDIPAREPLVHAIAWNLDADLLGLPGGALSGEPSVPTGRNSFLRSDWLPCDPPTGHGPHRYAFQLFALDKRLDFDSPPGRGALLAAMKGHVLSKGVLIGTYERVAPEGAASGKNVAAVAALAFGAGLLSVAFWRLRKRNRA
ncbi:YbhB/YbcL family Raf kinase inhibitor-like protein [Sphingoaurantiacus capsulatus]|uniref:YbhB/YbcL family Raf kinase inhibitor-like protein n=1 Tax=Sphingoaurantiacus capsulatus TaxID=1771310 RepID=A0ABV7X8W0_9SPHN